MATNDINFNGKTIRAAILAADNTIVGDIAKDSTLVGVANTLSNTTAKDSTLVGVANTLANTTAKDSTLTTIAATQQDLENLQETVKYLANILSQLGFTVDPASGRMRVTVEAGTLPTVTSVSTVTNLAQFGTISTAGTVFDIMQNTWASSLRSCIT